MAKAGRGEAAGVGGMGDGGDARGDGQWLQGRGSKGTPEGFKTEVLIVQNFEMEHFGTQEMHGEMHGRCIVHGGCMGDAWDRALSPFVSRLPPCSIASSSYGS